MLVLPWISTHQPEVPTTFEPQKINFMPKVYEGDKKKKTNGQTNVSEAYEMIFSLFSFIAD